MTEFEATFVTIERQPDKQISETHTENGGYKVFARKANGPTKEFDAMALNLNGFAFSAEEFSIAEYNQTVLVQQETEGGYLNLEVIKQ